MKSKSRKLERLSSWQQKRNAKVRAERPVAGKSRWLRLASLTPGERWDYLLLTEGLGLRRPPKTVCDREYNWELMDQALDRLDGTDAETLEKAVAA